jgi:peptidoglycan/xylan/chitin deacetylase (PgdA/CDA1 family)
MISLSPRSGIVRRLRARAAPLAKRALLRSGGLAALRTFAPSRRLAILRYHAICGPEGYAYADPQICVSPAAFEEHVKYLSSRYTIVRLDEAVERIRGQRSLPPNAVAVTFDDGYADNLAAARILARYGATATFYITAGCLADGQPFWPSELRQLVCRLQPPSIALRTDREIVTVDVSSEAARAAAIRKLTRLFKANPVAVRESLRDQLRAQARGEAQNPVRRVMLTWDEVREMHRLGMTIGSHTMTHPNLPNAGLDVARTELVESRQRLAEETGELVTMFSYPNGGAERYSTPELQRLVREVGYEAATTSFNGFAGCHSDLYALERVEVEEELSHLVFALEVERFAFKPRPRGASNPRA